MCKLLVQERLGQWYVTESRPSSLLFFAARWRGVFPSPSRAFRSNSGFSFTMQAMHPPPAPSSSPAPSAPEAM